MDSKKGVERSRAGVAFATSRVGWSEVFSVDGLLDGGLWFATTLVLTRVVFWDMD